MARLSIKQAEGFVAPAMDPAHAATVDTPDCGVLVLKSTAATLVSTVPEGIKACMVVLRPLEMSLHRKTRLVLTQAVLDPMFQ
jgi:hypothetical protein